jgi:hypothetical protein
VATSATFDRTADRCAKMCVMAITGQLAISGAISGETTETCGPTAAIFGMTGKTSGTIGATFATTAEGNTER